jgi:solute carrier family 30 (zinc transporter), member 5/7
MILAAFALGILSDASFSRVNMGRYLPGYGALLLHGLTTMALEHTVGFISPSLGPTFTMATATLGASIFCVPFYLFRNAVLHFPPTPHVPFLSVVTIPLIAYSLLFLSPLTKLSFNNLSLAPQFFQASFPILGGSSAILGPLIFSHYPSLSDLPLSLLLFTGQFPLH